MRYLVLNFKNHINLQRNCVLICVVNKHHLGSQKLSLFPINLVSRLK